MIKDTELYDLLYSSDLSLSFIFNILKNDDLTDKEEYWRNIPRNENSERFWFPLYSDFKYLSDNYDGNIDKQINEWDDNWDVCDEIPAKFLKKSETIYLPREDKKASYATFQQALAEKNKERSTRLLQSLADFGYAPAYAFLAFAYLHGSGCTASLASAKKYIHLAETAFAPGFDTHCIYADIKLKSENAEEIQEAINLYKNFSSQLDAVIVLVETVSADKKLRDFAKSLLAHGYSQIGNGYRLLGNEEEAKYWNARAALTNPRLLEDPAMQAVLTHLKTYHDYKNSLGV